MSLIYVKNKKGTTDKLLPYKYSSWLDLWEQKKGKEASGCSVYECTGSSDLGGHVIKVGEGGKEYILPMCYSCNNKPEDELFRAFESNLVSVK